MSDVPIAERIASLGESLRYHDLPKEVTDTAKKFVLDVLGCILGAKEVPSSKAVVETVTELGGHPVSTVLGYGFKTSPALAALANGVMGHALEMDDDHREGTQHPSVAVFPAVMALAEKYGVNGKTFLTAFVFGSEVTIRLGEAFLGKTYYQGFHPTGTCGVFGATAGTMKLLGLDRQKGTMALGIAGSLAAGITEFNVDGSFTKRFHPGHAAMGGVLATLLASKGFTGPRTVIEGENGFIRAFAFQEEYDLSRITDGLGSKWEMADTSIKVHACCRFSCNVADCAIDLYKQGVRAQDVEEITAKVNKFTAETLCKPAEVKYRPRNVVNAQFSLPYAIAVGICRGRASIFEFTEETIRDPEILALASKVRCEIDPEAEAVYPRYYPATVVVKTKEGKTYSAHVDYPKGDPENPVSFAEVADKFRLLAGLVMDREKIERVIDYVSNLENLETIDIMVNQLSSGLSQIR